MEIPKSHPRYRSLIIREKVVDGFRRGIVVPEGLIAHGRGEAFDYILGEKSWDFAIEAEKATVAWLLTANKPVISVNGNYAALAAREIGELARLTGAIVEVNLFYRTEDRVARIVDFLKQNGVDSVLDADCDKERISGLESPRGIVCRDGIWSADFVLLAMEDGDRTEAIKRMGKIVSAIDLNPFSRTAQTADITIVDEALRATNNMIEMARTLGRMSKEELEDIKKNYDNVEALKASFRVILSRLSEVSRKGLI
ncbi:MAG: phosphopantothenate/pantothenate synthetase [Desulfurococcales archaeon]|nr:phosphopantothenate/pantothenate synthetase [Desulfurococcales archaeon]